MIFFLFAKFSQSEIFVVIVFIFFNKKKKINFVFFDTRNSITNQMMIQAQNRETSKFEIKMTTLMNLHICKKTIVSTKSINIVEYTNLMTRILKYFLLNSKFDKKLLMKIALRKMNFSDFYNSTEKLAITKSTRKKKSKKKMIQNLNLFQFSSI